MADGGSHLTVPRSAMLRLCVFRDSTWWGQDKGGRLLLRPPHTSHSRCPERLGDGPLPPSVRLELSSQAQNHCHPIPGPQDSAPLPLTVQALLRGISGWAGAGEERAVLGWREPRAGGGVGLRERSG